MADQSTFRTEALRRYPKASLCSDGPWGVILFDGRTHVELFPTFEAAKKFAGGGFRIEFFGEGQPQPLTLFRIPGEGIDE